MSLSEGSALLPMIKIRLCTHSNVQCVSDEYSLAPLSVGVWDVGLWNFHDFGVDYLHTVETAPSERHRSVKLLTKGE